MEAIVVEVKSNSKLIKWFFPRWVNSFAFNKTIYVRKESHTLSDTQLNHELIHVAQYQKHGIIKFLYTYFIKEMFKKYRTKEYEIEAYKYQAERDYIKRTYKYRMIPLFK